MKQWIPYDKDEAASIIGEGLHTGLRKGTDAPEAHDLWVAISESGEAWTDALDYLLYGLDVMGLALCKNEHVPGPLQ